MMKSKFLKAVWVVFCVLSVIGLQITAFGDDSVNLITNGEFDKNLVGWFAQVHDTGAIARVSVVKDGGLSGAKAAKIAIKTPGVNNWDIELMSIFPVQKDKTYEVTFMAKATANTSISLLFQQNASPYTVYAANPVDVTANAQTYTISWKSTVDNPETRLNFNFGTCGAGDIFLDNVKVVEK